MAKRSATYYLDNDDGCIFMFRYDRTSCNEMANNKGEAVGKLMAMIVNELERLPNNESISITISKEY